MATVCPLLDKYSAVAQPQYPSPPNTQIFIWPVHRSLDLKKSAISIQPRKSEPDINPVLDE